MARGAIARFAATRALDAADGLKDFTGSSNEWSFDARASSSDVYVFKRGASKMAGAKVSAGAVKVEAQKRSSARKAIAEPRSTVTRSAPSPKAPVANSNQRPSRSLLASISKAPLPVSQASAAAAARSRRATSLNKK